MMAEKAAKTKKTQKTQNPHKLQIEQISNGFSETWTRQIIFIALVVVLIIFLFLNLSTIGAFIKRIVDILSPIILGWVLAFIVAPLYNRIVSKFTNHDNKHVSKFARPLATAICAVLLLVCVVGLVFLFVPQLYTSITRFISRSDSYVSLIDKGFNDIIANSQNGVTNQLLSQLEGILSSLSSSFSSIDISKIFGSIFSGFYVSFKAVLNFFIAFVVMIYSLNMKEDFIKNIKRILYALLRKDIAKKILVEAKFTKDMFSAFLFGKLVDSLIIGVLCYICCAIMKMPYTPLIAVIVGITNIIPFFGPFIGAVPAFLLILLEEPLSWKPFGFLVFILILQQIDGNIIGPKILGDKTGVGSFWVLFSILLFGGLFGFVGMIIAVPMWAVITRLFDQFIVIRLKEKEYPLSVDDYERLKEYNKHLNESEHKV